MSRKSPYDTLEVKKSATDDEIKSAFRRLAQKFHPDKNPGSKSAEEKFKEVNGAYEILKDPAKRRAYDEFGDQAVACDFNEETLRMWRQSGVRFGSSGGASGGADVRDNFVNVDFGNFASGGGFNSSIFDAIFGGASSGRRKAKSKNTPQTGEDLNVELTISLGTAIRGGRQELSFSQEIPCPACGGRKNTCNTCRGQGRIQSSPKSGTVAIPPGAREGMELRLKGQGAPGFNGGSPGDLYVTLHVAPHPSVRREGDDLFFELPITPQEALLGGEVRCPTFDGNFTICLKPHSQSGRKMRLKGLGVPRSGGGRGDFYAVLQIILPESDSEEVKRACEVLQKAFPRDERASVTL